MASGPRCSDLQGSEGRGLRGSAGAGPARLPLADNGRHAGGHGERGGVGGGEPLQADDHVVAAFGDGLPNVLFLGTKTKAKNWVRRLLHEGDIPKNHSPSFSLGAR